VKDFFLGPNVHDSLMAYRDNDDDQILPSIHISPNKNIYIMAIVYNEMKCGKVEQSNYFLVYME
jgi:hypothetical protein